MASQSLYRKWRSQTFSDLVGQEAIVRTLCHAVRDGRLAHAYLFCGPRGTGKTSVARLLAKAVNCANPHDGEPCNACVSCREITEGRSPDVFEIDAASNNGVDNIRELRENANILSSGGRYKVYVIDECHMLSTPAFNALLKTLEEPPPHILFVLATTEAHKVLPTIVSRCQQFTFSRHSRRNIVAHLLRVAEGEQLRLDRTAADVLARAAQGGMRDALSLLDQAMAFCGSDISLDGVRAMLGLAGPTAVRDLVEHVAAERSAEGLQLINELVTAGVDLRQLNSQLAEFWRALFLARAGADVGLMMDCGPDEAAEYAALAARFALEELTSCARVFAANETPARGLPVPQLGLELAFLECLSIRRRASAASATPPAAGATTGSAPTSSARPTPQPQSQAASQAVRLVAPVASSPASIAPASPPANSVPLDGVEELDLGALESAMPPRPAEAAPLGRMGAALAPDPLVSEAAADTAAVHAPVLDQPPDDEQAEGAGAGEAAGVGDWLQRVQDQWELVKKVCRQKRRTVAALLHSARPIMVAPGNPLEIVIQADYEFHMSKLREPSSRADVEWALEQVLECPCHIRLVLAGGGGENGNSSSGVLRTPPSRGPQAPESSNGNGHIAGGPVASAHHGSDPVPPPPPDALDSAQRLAAPRALDAAAAGALVQLASTGLANGHVYGHLQSTGARPIAATAGTTGLRDGDSVPAYAPANGASVRAAAPSPPADAVAALRALEEEARADPLIREIMRSFPADLVEVRPLEPDRED